MKNTIFQIALIITILTCFTGCYLPTQLKTNLDQSIEKNTKYLRQTFGPPTEIIDNATEGTIWYYSETGVRSKPGVIVPTGDNIIYTKPLTVKYEQYMRFWVSNEDRIYKWQTKGHELEKENWAVIIIVTVGTSILGGVLLAALIL